MSGRSWWTQAALGLLGVVALVFLIQRAGLDEIVAVLGRVRPAWLLAEAVLVAGIFLGFAIRWRLLLSACGADVPLRRLFGVRVAGLAVGTLTPGAKFGGEPLRAYLLARDGTPVGPAIATVVVDRGIELLANLVFAILYCGLFALRDTTTAWRVFVVVGIGGVALLVGVGVAMRRLERGEALVPDRFRSVLERLGARPGALAETEDALRLLLFERRSLVLFALAWALVMNAFIFLDYATIFRAFGPVPSISQLSGAMLGVGLAHALPVPASVGALEGAQVAVFQLSDGGGSLAIVAASVARIRDLVWTLPGVAYLAVSSLRGRAGKG